MLLAPTILLPAGALLLAPGPPPDATHRPAIALVGFQDDATGADDAGGDSGDET